ncbi:MAG: hypothetical protein F6J98_25855 [Moorea sp. SIO4G2]|nr:MULTISPECIES: hypothetical protein [unclassified Moorena]NEO16682.1 hypothetical protein [Moorena sp. SIO3E8]NEO44813.1 hypothetical protein [Moorena sp. SIO4A3]NEO63669.1 hypothetical protein [Moorena sp. SIO4G2]NEP98637.1 hypothetical protein [Moorena sp. SIO3F7]
MQSASGGNHGSRSWFGFCVRNLRPHRCLPRGDPRRSALPPQDRNGALDP